MGAKNGKGVSSSLVSVDCLCEVCGDNPTGCSLQNKAEYKEESCCSRCRRKCCCSCAVWRCYRSGSTLTQYEPGVSPFSMICRSCNSRANLVQNTPRAVWIAIAEFCDVTTKNCLLQLCHATQLGVVLPYPYTLYGWNAFFLGRHFISKGANGEVYQATVRYNAGAELACTSISSADADRVSAHAGQTVAVKTIQKSRIFSMRKWEHIEREVTALRRCSHDHVVQLYFVAQGPSEVYIVLQYVAGGDLFDWLVHQQVPMEQDVVVIARQLMETLRYMHDICGVVHRDIKPENILLETRSYSEQYSKRDQNRDSTDGSDEYESGADLFIRLGDFGYAKLLPTAMDSSPLCSSLPNLPVRPPLPPRRSYMQGITIPYENRALLDERVNNQKSLLISSTPCGTLGFAAPEILSAYNAQREAARRPRTNHATDDKLESPSRPQTSIDLVKRMDIFAAGVTFCILLTGCEPFPCCSSKEHMDAVQNGMSFAGPQWRYVSREAKNLLIRMLAPKASDRPSAQECLKSAWLRQCNACDGSAADEDEYRGIRHMGGMHHSTSMWQFLSTSFQNSVHSLRKNEGWLFVQDAEGLVTTIPRQLVSEREDEESLPASLHLQIQQGTTSAIS